MQTSAGPQHAPLLGGGLLLVLTALALLAPVLAPTDPFLTVLDGRLAPPGYEHLLGQDTLGRDVLTRLLYGARISLSVAGATVALSLLVGVSVGAVAGYCGGWVDELLARVIDVLLAFPGLLLAIALAAVLGPSITNVVLALSLLGWTGYARLVRTQVAALAQQDLALASRALGASPVRVVIRHLLPLVVPALAVQATFGAAGAIIAEASLSFLGLGAPAPEPSWGAMLNEGRGVMLTAPHLTLAAGAALALTVLAFNRLGDGLRARLAVPEKVG